MNQLHPPTDSRLRAAGSAGGGEPPALRRRPRRRFRIRWWWIAAAVVAVLLGLVLASPSIARWYLTRRALPRLAQRFGRQISIEHVEVGLHRVSLVGLEVRSGTDRPRRPMLRVPLIEVDYRLGALLAGKLAATLVRVEKPVLQLWRDEDGKSNFADLLARRPRTGTKGGGEGKLKLDRVLIEHGRVAVQDDQIALELKVADLSAEWQRGKPPTAVLSEISLASPLLPSRAVVAHVEVRGRPSRERVPEMKLRGGRVQLLPRLELSGIHGTVKPDARGVGIDLAGSYGGAAAELWSARGWIDPVTRKGKVQVRAAKFSLGRIATILRESPVIRPEGTEVSGRLDITVEPAAVAVDGGLAITNLNLFHPRVARTPIGGLSLSTDVSVWLAHKQRLLTIEQLKVKTGEVEATLTGTVALGKQPAIDLRLTSPAIPCQKVLDAFPPALVPELQGFRLKGSLEVDVHTHIDYAELDALDLGGKLGLYQCKVVEVPERVSAERLAQPFEHIVEAAPGELQTHIIGADNPNFVPFLGISPHAVNAFLTTEDASFFRHRGFVTSQFRVALARNLSRSGFRLGASTISMQMVKNVLLSHEKTLSRKLQEMFLTWYLEQELSKERIMEIYLNAIEFGPRLFGIGNATRHYFNKTPIEITPLEASFLATILPNPRGRHAMYCRGEVSAKWHNKMRRILKRMHARELINDEDLQAALDGELVFARDFATLSKRDCLEDIDEITDAWREERQRRLIESVQRAAPHQLELYTAPPEPSNGGQ